MPPRKDTDNLNKSVSRGNAAKALMENPMLTQAFDDLEAAIRRQWEQSTPGQKDVREKAFDLLTLAKSLRAHFQAVMVKGTNAERILREEEDVTRGPG